VSTVATVAQVSTAIVVPGHATRGRDGVYRISATCRGLLREAERIAERTRVDAVILTGWAPNGGASEAEQMRDAWRGPEVELVVEPTASVTAENASRTVPLLVERGIERAIVVCARFHVYRSRFFFSRLYEAAGIRAEFRVADAPTGVRALAWELAAAMVCRRQLRAAKAELARAAGT
jgi:uncharacterized SAM-binding protein YcdF (DUF218 family)